MPCLLIVDDDNINLKLIENVLKNAHEDYSFLCASSGEEALAFVEKQKPDIILLDVLMPDISGFEVCKRLKGHDEYKTIPILLITGLDSVEQKVTGFKLGAADYITKPINADELKARVEAHLRIKKYHDELVKANQKLIKTQSVLVENAKMSAVGSLAAGVAHEFNNILLMMGGYVQIYTGSDNVNELKSAFSILSELVERGENIVKGLLDFARKDKFQVKAVKNLAELLKQDLVFLKKELEANEIDIDTYFDDVPNVACYPGQVSQVFVNVIRNAIDSMRKQSRRKLTIRVEKTTEQKTEQKNNPKRFLTEESVIISFSDTGSGILPEVRDKLFEPFVTTKGVLGGGNDSTPGTGLGLSISYGIMQRHDGSILMSDNSDKGTTVILSFPVTNEGGQDR